MALTDTDDLRPRPTRAPPAIREPSSRRLVGDRWARACCCWSSSAGSSWPTRPSPHPRVTLPGTRGAPTSSCSPTRSGRTGVGAGRAVLRRVPDQRCRWRERCCSASSGMDQYSFSAFLMIGIPVLTGLALGAGAFRSRRDPLAMLMTMIVPGGAVPHHPVRRLPGQHHGPVPAGADVPVPARGANLVGREDRVVPDRDRGGVHAPDDVRDLRRRVVGDVRVPLPDEPVLVRIGAPRRTARC